MVVKEYIENKSYIHSYSDDNKKIRQISTGNIYDDAIDLIEYPQEYEETELYIE